MATGRFNKAYNALVKAYFEGSLAKGDCAACAVGNIVGDSLNAKIAINMEWGCAGSTIDNRFWNKIFFTDIVSRKQWISNSKNQKKDGVEITNTLFDLTGYTWKELAKIEHAFETNTKINIKDYSVSSQQQILEDQFSGLTAVIDVMMKLDEMGEDKSYVNKFREHPRLATV